MCSHPAPLVRPGRPAAALAVAVGLFAGWLIPAALAQPPAINRSRVETVRQADVKFRAGDLVGAERLYRRALEGAGYRHEHCFDRLLDIYTRLERVDQVVQIATQHRDYLRRLYPRGPLPPEVPARLAGLELRIGDGYLLLGHRRESEQHFRQALAQLRRSVQSNPMLMLNILASLGRSAERRGDARAAEKAWREVELVARRELERPVRELDVLQQIECVWRLSDAYRFLKNPDEAVRWLEPLLAFHDRRRDLPGKRETLRRLAAAHAARGAFDRAEKYLREALAAQDELHGSRIVRGDVAAELAGVLAGARKNDEAAAWRKRAAEDYAAAMGDAKSDQARSTTTLTAFWKLQKLLQETSQYNRALRMADDQAEVWAGDVLVESRLTSERGALQVLLGSYAQARPLLAAAVKELKGQSPPNLVDLPRALNNLAIVEQAAGNGAHAETLARDSLALYERHQIPPDLVQVETLNLLGNCAFEAGRYAKAVEWFDDGLKLCGQLGEVARMMRSNLLLNKALLYRSQGDLEGALRACEAARAEYERVADPDAPGLAAFDAAVAGMVATQGNVNRAYQETRRIRRLCDRYQIKGGPLVVVAGHCEGLYHLYRRELADAERAWREVLQVQQKEKTTAQMPRTLNYLALTAEVRGQLDEAEKLYSQARDLQKDVRHSFPMTHAITLQRLAGLLDRRGKKAEARALLEEALKVVEEVRVQTAGAAEQRATFFAQAVPVYDRLVDWCVRDGDVEGALAIATRVRSLGLLDQLQLAGADPRKALTGPKGEALRRAEESLRRQVSSLRARAQLIPADPGSKQTRALLKELETAQQEYARVWSEILNANPTYHSLSSPDPARTVLPALRQRVLGSKALLLAYYIGRSSSYLLLVGGPGTRSTAYPLTVPAVVSQRIAATEPLNTRAVLTHRRGLVLRPRAQQPPVPPPGPLNHFVASALVDQYLHEILDRDFQATRGLKLVSRNPQQPVPPQPMEVLGNVLLPEAARRRIADLKPECLVVIPDGPLHKLPLEALLLRARPTPRFVLDELPPIVYAPSASVLELLAGRKTSSGPLTLLTVSNPAYPAGPGGPGEVRSTSRAALAWAGQIPALPFTKKESDSIRDFFDPAQVTTLEGEQATKRKLVDAVARKRIVHVAAHGFADDNFGNLFGALALAPSARPGAADDGFLSLNEIYTLPLGGCDLAVLSACVTNVGPQRPLEAGVTLASGFLAAGARRVVASNWSVDDESTAALMKTFFEEVTEQSRGKDVIHYAQALHKARLRVRNDRKWASPFHWASFVLIGPPE